jgi:NAD(P)-dependent dehydrogenase (short-subunit alcohol dehydrogenase family)
LPRIVFVSSEVHRSAPPIDAATLGNYRTYNLFTGMRQYAHSKLAVCTYASTLSRRLRDDRGVDVAVHAICPGPVDSNMARNAPAWVKPVLRPLMHRFFASPADAARPVTYLAASPAIEGQTDLYLHRSEVKDAADPARDAARGDAVWDAAWALLQRAGVA